MSGGAASLAQMEVAILCGGKGVRMRHEVPQMPKPLVEVGGRPILWHVMQLYAHAGVGRFVLCLGYKGAQIRAAFAIPGAHAKAWGMQHWDVCCRATGQETNTGGRIKRIAGEIRGENFFATYGDGVADIDLARLLAFHHAHGRAVTITCVRPTSPFGMVQIEEDGSVTAFAEKPRLHQWINGGFFVFNRRVFDYLRDDDVLESDTFHRLVADHQLMAYQHDGFWMCMDTYKDHLMLNQLWQTGNRPWARWLERAVLA